LDPAPVLAEIYNLIGIEDIQFLVNVNVFVGKSCGGRDCAFEINDIIVGREGRKFVDALSFVTERLKTRK
jgi:hypothetical protein